MQWLPFFYWCQMHFDINGQDQIYNWCLDFFLCYYQLWQPTSGKWDWNCNACSNGWNNAGNIHVRRHSAKAAPIFGYWRICVVVVVAELAIFLCALCTPTILCVIIWRSWRRKMKADKKPPYKLHALFLCIFMFSDYSDIISIRGFANKKSE